MEKFYRVEYRYPNRKSNPNEEIKKRRYNHSLYVYNTNEQLLFEGVKDIVCKVTTFANVEIREISDQSHNFLNTLRMTAADHEISETSKKKRGKKKD